MKKVLSGLKGAVLFNEPMSKHTSFMIGGPAEVMVFPADEAELACIINSARAERIPLFVLGEGSNLLVRDKGIKGIVISLSSPQSGDSFRKIVPVKEDASQSFIYAGAGIALSRLLSYTVQKGLTGIEFTAGIPGSLGGAVIMNAGSYGKEMKDILESVRIIDRMGKITDIPAKDILFKYRCSHIHGIAVVGALLKLKKGDQNKIKEAVRNNLLMKKGSQPLTKPNAGSIFKNPYEGAAWKLIDSVGMRGVTAGGAIVSEKHTNFILNNGSANARDVITLIRQIGSRVEKEKGITLELEVRIVGAA
ncbi:MAG: UDP-N-acetylmuramate dehydrogenase [Nitrospirae bacterium]|nr:UDP-N-acetylmuramate dehydrogenase [Nitrospirota bacterium]